MEFYVCFTDFGHPSQQCKSDEKSERLDGGGVSHELLGP